MQIGSVEALKAQMEKCIVSDCKDCPYTDAQICDTAMTKDALEYIESLEERIAIKDEALEALEKRCNALEALEKQNEPVEPEAFMDDTEKRYRCKCGTVLMKGFRYHWNYCPKCGQAVKWE